MIEPTPPFFGVWADEEETTRHDGARRVAGAGGRPLLVSGAGAALSAGLDLKEVGVLDRPGMARLLGLLDALVDALFDYAGPRSHERVADTTPRDAANALRSRLGANLP